MADNGSGAEASSYFETGKQEEAWTAQWITPDEEITDTDTMAGYILEKEFRVREGKDARLYLCGLGVYECYINGKKAGDEYRRHDMTMEMLNDTPFVNLTPEQMEAFDTHLKNC